MPERRPLSFARLDDVMPEVDRLLAGYERRGAWSLGQVCQHLAVALQLTVEGGGRRGPWVLRAVIGPIIRRHILRTGRIPGGIKVPHPRLTPSAEADDRAEAESLRATIRLFLAEPGPFATHPSLGAMDADQWRRFHCIHCAHHLSFLRPKG